MGGKMDDLDESVAVETYVREHKPKLETIKERTLYANNVYLRNLLIEKTQEVRSCNRRIKMLEHRLAYLQVKLRKKDLKFEDIPSIHSRKSRKEQNL